MATQHSAIADAQRHEPKGFGSAAAGEVRVADGLGGGSMVFLNNFAASDIVGTLESCLTNSSTATQTPTALDTALQVSYGPAVNTLADPVMIDGTGTVTFNEGGLYFVRLYLQIGRVSGSGVARILTRSLINGTIAGDTLVQNLETANALTTQSAELFLQVPAATTLATYIMRDSTGSNDGRLITFTPALGTWSAAPSARIRVDRINYGT